MNVARRFDPTRAGQIFRVSRRTAAEGYMETSVGEAAWPMPEERGKRELTPEEGETPSLEQASESKRPRAGPPRCTHQIVFPPGAAVSASERYLDVPETFRAFDYPFELDEFQKTALAAIERNDSVMVSAHTSAGKTVVAQYAIALSLQRRQRVVYTSPIKALSNQKYRELSAAFGGDVGLMTGDVNVNVDASCLVMTTEILRSMLYKGHELIREVQWVIFDEVHYMRDKERGVIWEECIILLPRAMRFVFLSATVPNGREFASWVAQTHGLPCHLISTPYRPTPLQHWVYPLGGDGLHLLVDEQGRFSDRGYDSITRALHQGSSDGGGEGGKGGKGGGGGGGGGGGRAARLGSRSSPELGRLLRLLVHKDLTPAIVFSFSRRECEGAAMGAKGLNALPDAHRATVREVFEAAIATLSSDDQQIRQVGMLLPMLERGVAVHHSGMLPVLREVVEILFQEGLVKLLFATETFSMGVNMPARTVVFTSLRKWDGETFRPPTSAEYIQMSGRAGRRGLDAKGVVVLMLGEPMERDALKTMTHGDALPLSSSFRLRYNTLLRLYGMESLHPEALIAQSFYAFQRAQGIPAVDAKRRALLRRARWMRRQAVAAGANPMRRQGVAAAGMSARDGGKGEAAKGQGEEEEEEQQEEEEEEEEEQAEEEEEEEGTQLQQRRLQQLRQILTLRASREKLVDRAMAMALKPRYALRFLQPGRVVRVGGEGGGEVGGGGGGDGGGEARGEARGWGVVLGFRHDFHRAITDELAAACTGEDFVLDVLLPSAAAPNAGGAGAVAGGGGGGAGAAAAAAAAAGAAGAAGAAAAGFAAAGSGASPLHPGFATPRLTGRIGCLTDESHAHPQIVTVRLSAVTRLSAARLWLPSDLRTERSQRRAMAALRELMAHEQRLGGERAAQAACLHPIEHLMGRKEADAGCHELMVRADQLAAREMELRRELSAELFGTGLGEGSVADRGSEAAVAVASSLTIDERLDCLANEHKLEAAAAACSSAAVELTTNEFSEQTARMRMVLRRLGHLDDDNVVQLKGRAAAEIEACDELLAAELILSGVFNALTAQACVALCACLVAEQSETVKRPPPMHADLCAPFAKVRETAESLCTLLNDCAIETNPLEYVARFDGGLVNVMYAWANGATFDELTSMCDLFEGSIIRAVRRLSELLDELKSAAKAIGNEELFDKLEAGAKLIRRDICFAASLYIEG